MTRVSRGYIARRRRTKMRSFASNFRGAHLRLNRMITQQVRRAFVSSHRDRGRQKRDFRRLWITRINAATRVYNVFNSYSKLIHNLSKKELILNRKMLAQVELWIKNWWNTRQSETFLTDIQEKRILEGFIELEELFLLDEMRTTR